MQNCKRVFQVSVGFILSISPREIAPALHFCIAGGRMGCRMGRMKNNFASVKVGQKFTWQNSSFWMVKTGDDSATYLDGSQLEAANKPSAFRVCGKIKR